VRERDKKGAPSLRTSSGVHGVCHARLVNSRNMFTSLTVKTSFVLVSSCLSILAVTHLLLGQR
jgi:hypothetical protein